MINFRITLTGTAPLLMHNSQLADPLNPIVKEKKKVSSKRTKTDDDHAEMARLEYLGSLYLIPEVGPYLPGQNIERALLDAARISKQGKKIERGIFIQTDENPLSYKGPRAAADLWADENFRLMASVKQQTSRIMRCRPMFREWACAAEGILDPSVIDIADLETIATTAGQMIGIGDWRPRYGRFTATVERIAGQVAA